MINIVIYCGSFVLSLSLFFCGGCCCSCCCNPHGGRKFNSSKMRCAIRPYEWWVRSNRSERAYILQNRNVNEWSAEIRFFFLRNVFPIALFYILVFYIPFEVHVLFFSFFAGFFIRILHVLTVDSTKPCTCIDEKWRCWLNYSVECRIGFDDEQGNVFYHTENVWYMVFDQLHHNHHQQLMVCHRGSERGQRDRVSGCLESKQ